MATLTAPTFYSIDYYAFTIPLRGIPAGEGEQTKQFVLEAFASACAAVGVPVPGGHVWEIEKAKGFYSWRARNVDSKIAVSWGNVNPHLYVELSGFTCAFYDGLGILDNLIYETRDRASRVDFAVDVECDNSVESIIVNNEGIAFKSHAFISSPQGDTYYVGSRKSERFARVYRYHKPHPRHTLLRFEVEYKGEACKALLQQFRGVPNAELTAIAHAPFKWKFDPMASFVGSASKLPARDYDKGDPSTVRWLCGTVASSLRQAFLSGLITPQEWLQSTDLHQWLGTTE